MEVLERSMEPALSPGDRLLVERRPYRDRAPARGDIVVVEDPEGSDRYLVKRVVALGGEIPPGVGTPVPAAHLWIEGDWPAVSRDSRRFGPVPIDRIWGRAWHRYYPPSRVGSLDGSQNP